MDDWQIHQELLVKYLAKFHLAELETILKAEDLELHYAVSVQ